MSSPPHQTQIWRMARAAGCLYAAIILLGLSAELGIRVAGSSSLMILLRTVSAILTHGGLFRLGSCSRPSPWPSAMPGLHCCSFFMFQPHTAPALASIRLWSLIRSLLQTGVIRGQPAQSAGRLAADKRAFPASTEGDQATMAMQFLLLHSLWLRHSGPVIFWREWVADGCAHLGSRVFSAGFSLSGWGWLVSSILPAADCAFWCQIWPRVSNRPMASRYWRKACSASDCSSGSGFASKQLEQAIASHTPEEK